MTPRNLTKTPKGNITMKPLRLILPLIFAASLAACAGSVSAPTTIQAMSPDVRASLRVSNVSADAASGVEMSDADFDAVCQKVKAHLPAGVLADSGAAGTYAMKIHFTRFDRGSAAARALLIGLGQIRIEATVSLVDGSGNSVAQYGVAKDFALGGIAGATTSVDDVEDGFAKSIVEIVKAKA